MAIIHTRIKTYSRAKGHSALAAAAYRGGYLLNDPKSGAKHDYRGRAGIIQSRCLTPPGSPSWADDPQALWAAAEAAEHRKNSTVCRDFTIALPHELNDAKRWELTCSGLMTPDTHLGEHARHAEVSDEQTATFVFP